MRSLAAIISALSAALVGYGTSTGPSLAVVSEPLVKQEIKHEAPATVEPHSTALQLNIPVAWQLTRTRLVGRGAATLTETFHETWTLEVRPGGVINLRSPRATVPAYAVSSESLKNAAPKSVIVADRDLARLIGVESGDTIDEGEGGVPVAAPVTIHIGKTGKAGTDVNLNWSEEEHYAVHIDAGTAVAF